VDIEFIVSLVFSLLVIIIVGGSILLFPITRRLGLLLERRLETEALPGDELRQLKAAVRSLTDQVQSLQDRQDFTEKLLAPGSGEAPRPRQELPGDG
jgi:hypothetical protein